MNVPFLKNLSFLLTRVIFCWSLSKCYWPSLTLVLGHDILIFLWKKISLSVTRWVKVHFKFSLFQLSSWNICSLSYILQKPCSLLHYNLGLALSTDCWPKYCAFMTYILLCGFFLLFFSLFFFFYWSTLKNGEHFILFLTYIFLIRRQAKNGLAFGQKYLFHGTLKCLT